MKCQPGGLEGRVSSDAWTTQTRPGGQDDALLVVTDEEKELDHKLKKLYLEEKPKLRRITCGP